MKSGNFPRHSFSRKKQFDVAGNVVGTYPGDEVEQRGVREAQEAGVPVVPHAHDLRPGPARYCSPRHRKPFESRNEGSQCVSMTWRAIGLADIARHVI